MRIVFSPHAKQRMAERNIKKRHIVKVLKNPDTTYPCLNPNKMCYGRNIGERRFKVIFKEQKEKLVVITAWEEER